MNAGGSDWVAYLKTQTITTKTDKCVMSSLVPNGMTNLVLIGFDTWSEAQGQEVTELQQLALWVMQLLYRSLTWEPSISDLPPWIEDQLLSWNCPGCQH